MKAVMTEIEKSPNVIIFIDELHTIVGAGGASGSLDASNMFKPALARGEIQCVGATTLDEYRQYIEKDGALARRFQMVMVDATTPDETTQILENIKVKDYITEMIASIGENINLRRIDKISISNGVISSYIHNQVIEGMGKIGVLVGLESEADNDQLEDLGKKIAMHIAATNPISVSIEDIPADILEREKSILAEEARSSGKPEEIIEKMTEGRLKKYYQESVLLEQIFVVDGESKISDILNSLDKPVKIIEFVRMGLGEGIEKKNEDFANEVDSLIS